MTRFLILLALLSSAANAMTLKQAVDRALEQDASVQTEEQKVIQAEKTYSSAISGIFPTITGNVTANYRKDSVGASGVGVAFGGTPYNQYIGQLVLNQPIYHGGAIWAGLQNASLARDVEHYRLDEISRVAAAKTFEAYLQTLLAKRKLDSYREIERIEIDSLNLTQKRLRTGRSQKLDLLQSKTVIALLMPKIAQAERDMKLTTATLARLIHFLDKDKITLENEIFDVPTLKADTKVGSVEKEYELKNPDSNIHPQLARLKAQEKQTGYLKDIALAPHFPQLNFVGTLGRTTFRKIDLADNGYNAWSLGLQLSIPLFSGLSSFSDSKVQAAKMKEAEIELADAFEAQSLTEVQAKENYETSKTVLRASREAFEIANESLKEAKKSYSFSTIDQAQFLSIHQNFLDARIAYDQSKYDVWISLSKYFDALGLKQYDLINLYDESKTESKNEI